MSNILIAHGDTARVEEAQVMAIPAGEYTATFHPVAHGEIITSLESACKNWGIEIRGREYSLNAAGTRMFGAWTLNMGNGGMKYALGIRNAIDKSMAYGVCAGTSVDVCDNMLFSGSFITFRKHTSGLVHEELIKIADEALGGAIIEMEKLHGWQNDLHDTYVPKLDRKGLVYDMMDQGVFSPGQFKNYHAALDEELQINHQNVLDGAHSLYRMHGAATRIMRGQNMLRTSKQSAILNGVCDDYLVRRAA